MGINGDLATIETKFPDCELLVSEVGSVRNIINISKADKISTTKSSD